MKEKIKRICIISDMHCGHKYGLVPPNWQSNTTQKIFWSWYKRNATKVNPIYALIVNGDAVDGKGYKSGGVELITRDRTEQVNMALECIRAFRFKKVVILRGTPYHVGKGENWEDILADKLGTVAKDALLVEVNGLKFDIRHFVGISSDPQSRTRSITKEHVWNILLATTGAEEKADILVRSHVHYHVVMEDFLGLRMTTPGLQLFSRFGLRKCIGSVDCGFVCFDIEKKGKYTWKKILMRSKLASKPVLKL